MTRFLYDRLRAEVAELRRRLSVLSSTITGGGPHASNHEDGGSDEIDVTGLSGVLADPQTPAAHATSHQNAGSDEISVTGLSGLLADAQAVGVRKNSTGSTFTRPRLNLIEGTNITLTVADDVGNGEVDITIDSTADAGSPAGGGPHATSHENGGDDEISVTGLSGMLADAQLVGVRKNSTGSTFTRQRLNFIEGANVTLTVADDGGNGEVDITIEAVGAGSPSGGNIEATVGATFTGTDLAVGRQRIIRVPHGFLPLTWVVYTDATLSIVVDIWADSLANYPPADADTITGGNEPEISGAVIDDGDASAFDPIAAGDFVTFNIDSVTVGSATWATVQLIGTRT